MIQAPADRADVQRMEPTSGRSTAVGSPAPALAALTALIVDDEAHARTYLRLVLNSLGVTTIWEATHGKEGLELYQYYRPDVVLLDVNLPLMSGEQVMAALTQIDPGAAVVIVTSQNEHETVKQFVRLGAMGYVLKHLAKEEMAATFAELLGCLVAEDEQSA